MIQFTPLGDVLRQIKETSTCDSLPTETQYFRLDI